MEQLVLSLPFNTSYDPADFVVSHCNQMAFDKIRQRYIPPSHILGIIGASGTGKTHLTSVFHSVNPTASQITNHILKTSNDLFAIPAHSFIIDDADKITEEVGFFHIINIAKQRKGMVLFTAQTPPATWKIRLPDLKSRLCSSDIVHLEKIDSVLYQNILEKLFSDRQIIVHSDIIEFILTYIQPDIHNFKKFVDDFDNLLLRHRKPPSKTLVREVFFEDPHLMNEIAQQKFLGTVLK